MLKIFLLGFKSFQKSLSPQEKQAYKSLTDALVKRYLKAEFGAPDFAKAPESKLDEEKDEFLQRVEEICGRFDKDVATTADDRVENFGYGNEQMVQVDTSVV